MVFQGLVLRAMGHHGHHPQGLPEPLLRPLTQRTGGQQGQELSGLLLTALDDRKIVGIGLQGSQEVIQLPVQPVAGIGHKPLEGLHPLLADQGIGIAARREADIGQLQFPGLGVRPCCVLPPGSLLGAAAARPLPLAITASMVAQTKSHWP